MGGGSTNGTSSSSAVPIGEYTNAKTSVLWDIENCHVPRGCDPNAIAQNISAALENMNYRGQITITAYGDTSKIPQSVQHALSSTGITLNHVPAGVKDASDKRILVDMMLWAIDNPAPANYLLISGDRDFSNALHQLRLRRYNILLAQPQNVSAPLVAAAKTVWLWTSLVAGGAALSSGDSLQSINNNNNNTPQGDPGPAGHAFESNNLANHRSYGIGRTDVKSKTKQPWRSPTQPNLSRSSSNLRQPPFGTQEGTTTGGSDKFNQKMNLSAPQQNQIPTSRPRSTESQDFNVSNFTGASASVFHQSLMNTTDSNSRPPSSSSSSSHQSGYAQGKQFNEAPHNFFVDNMSSVSSGPSPNFGPSHPDLTRNNVNHFASNYTNQYCPPPLKPSDLTQQPAFMPGNLFLPNSHVHNPHPPPPRPDGPAFTSGPHTNIPDISMLLISEHPNLVHSTSSFQSNGAPGMSAVSEPSNHHKFSEQQYSHPPQGTLPFYPNTSNIGNYPRGPEYRPPTAPALDKTSNPSSGGPRGPPGYPQASTHDLGLVGIVLLALDTLKADMIVPTEANIADCIHHGKLNQPNFDVKTALSRALDLQMVVMHSAGGALQIYVPKSKKLWKCVNPINCNIKNGKEKCEAVQKFIMSVGGRATITASPSRYKAAEILKSRCLTDSTLGEVFQILHMIITVKKWIIPHPSGWQPLSITIPEDGANLAI